MARIILLMVIGMFISGQNLIAQALYPVTAILDVQGPYSPVFSTFSDPSNQAFRPNKMALRLRLNDLNEASLAVRLKWEISGPGIEFQTNDDFLGGIANLISGQYITLDNAALTPYFDLFGSSGISDEFVTGTGGYLTEGSYSFCVTAFELTKGQQVSNTSCREIYIEEYEPPFLNNPSGSITPTFPQNLQISWTPRHFGVFPVIYNVKIWETFEGLTPDQVVSSQMPYITLDVNQVTQTFLNSQNGLLTPGRSYLAQVQIRDGVNGPFGMPTVIFKNNGNSEILAFTYGAAYPEGVCIAPLDFRSELDDQQNVVLFWQESDPTLASNIGRSTQIAYQIKYREVGATEWQIKETSVRTLLMTGLRQGETYEIELYKVCLNGLTAGGALKVLVPKRNKARTLPDCGEEMDISGMSDVPLERLAVNDTIFASGTEVIVQEVAGSGGVFTGKGFIRLPLLSTIKIAVEFDAISVNEDFELTAGEIRTVYNPGAGNVVDLKFNSDQLSDYPTFTYQDSFKIISLTADGTLIYLDGREVLVNGAYIKGKGLNQFVFSGERFEVFEEYEKFDSLGPVRVKFAASGNQRYGFDAYKPAIDKEYEKYFDLPVSYKSVAEGAFDEVEVFVEGGLEEGDTIVFVDELTKAELQFSPKGVSTKYRVNAMGPGRPSAIIAYVINKGVAGKLNIYSTPITKVPIKIVNVNGVSGNSAGVESTINKIFAPGLFKVEVVGQDDFDYVEKEDGIINVENHFLNAYSPDMKKLADEYFKTRGQLDETFYLFVSDKIEASTQGLMPQGYAAGFISSTASAQVYAHELAHGIFNFDHSWLMYGLDSMKTQNLMDYSGGTELWYRQWKQMVSPGFPKGWRKDEKDGKYASVKEDIEKLINTFGNKEKKTITFALPNGGPITLKQELLESVTFATGENYITEEYKPIPLGSLVFFGYDGKSFEISSASNITEIKNGTSFKKDPEIEDEEKGVVGFMCFMNGGPSFTAYDVQLSKSASSSLVGIDFFWNKVFANFVNTENKSTELSITTTLNADAKTYIENHLEDVSCGQRFAPFYLVNAFQLNYFPFVYINCTTDSPDASSYPFIFSFSENIPEGLTVDEATLKNLEFSYNSYKKIAEAQNSILDSEFLKIDNKRDIIDKLKSYSEEGLSCVFRLIDIETKLYILKVGFGESIVEGRLLIQLMSSTDEIGDWKKILNQLHTQKLLGLGIDELSGSDESDYYDLISKWLKQINSDKADQVNSICIQNGLDSKGQTVFAPECFFWDITNDNKKTIRYKASTNEFYIYDPTTMAGIVKAYDDVICINYTTNNKNGIKEGTIALVSVVDAYRIYMDERYADKIDAIVKAVDLIAIAISVPSGGSSLGAVGWIDLTVTSTDFILRMNSDQLIKYTPNGEEILAGWDKISIASGLPGLVVITKGAVNYVKVAHGGSVVSAIKSLSSELKQSAVGVYEQGLSSTKKLLSYVSNTDEVAKNLLNAQIKLLIESKSNIQLSVKSSISGQGYLSVKNLDEVYIEGFGSSKKIGNIVISEDGVVTLSGVKKFEGPFDDFEELGFVSAKVDSDVEETLVIGRRADGSIVGRVQGPKNVITHIIDADVNSLQNVTTTLRSGGVRAINNIKNLVNEGKALVVNPIAGSTLAQKIDDYINAFNNNNSALQGQIGEEIAELIGKEINPTGDVINMKINNSGHGFDVLSFAPNKSNPTFVKIFEAKPFNGTSVELPFTVNSGTQMSTQWIQSIINQMRNHSDQSILQIGNVMNTLMLQNKVDRFIVTVDKALKQVIILKLDNF